MWGGRGVTHNHMRAHSRKSNKSHFMFSSRLICYFQQFYTNNSFSFCVFFAVYAIKKKKIIEWGGGGCLCQNKNSHFMFCEANRGIDRRVGVERGGGVSF